MSLHLTRNRAAWMQRLYAECGSVSKTGMFKKKESLFINIVHYMNDLSFLKRNEDAVHAVMCRNFASGNGDVESVTSFLRMAAVIACMSFFA